MRNRVKSTLVFDNEGEYTPESMARLMERLGSYGGDRSRPYDGQPWTSLGERGKEPVRDVTMRDIGDCIARGAVLAGVEDLNLAVIQNALCELEKLMGIFPNVPARPTVIPMLTLGDAPEPPEDAS